MGTIAEKLTYLNDTKQLLKENINNLGGNLTNEPFRQYASVLEGIYERLPKVSGIGASLSLSPSMVGKIKLNEIQGNTLQNGTPAPSSPVPIQSVTGLQNVEVCGKNMLDYSTMVDGNVTSTGTIFPNTSNGEMCSDFIQVKPNTKYTFKIFETSSTYDNWFGVGEYTSNNENSFIQRDTTNNVSQNYITFTTTATTNYVRLSGRNLKSATKVQFELGNATTYEAYKGNTYNVNLGKNLLDLTDGTYSNNGITAIVEKGKITLNGTASATSFITIPLLSEISLGIANKTLSLNNSQVISDTSTECRLYTSGQDYNSVNFSTINKSTTFSNDRVYTRLQIRTSSGVTFNNFVFKPQLEKGSTATSYSPYFTPYELNKIGTYEDSIKKSTGKNLFDKNTITENYRIGSDGLPYADNSCSLSDFIKVEPNTTYYINQTMSYQNTTALYDINKNYISPRIQSGNTFTTTSSTYYVRVSNLKANINTLMLNEGSTALPYEPYGKVWYKTKNIDKVVLDGTESNIGINQRTNGYQFDFANPLGMNGNSDKVLMLSQNFRGIKFNDRDNYNESIYSWSNDNRIRILTNVATTVNDFKTWLSAHNTEVLFILATPIYEVITNTELINQLESLNNAKSKNGTTNINVTSEDLSMLLNVSVIKGDA